MTVDFSDIIAIFNCNIRSSFNKELRNRKTCFRLGATSNDLLHFINLTLKGAKLKRQ